MCGWSLEKSRYDQESDRGGHCPMERLNEYREIIRAFLAASIDESSDDQNFETQLICDRDRDHYQLVSLGWQGHRRFYDVLIHLDIKAGKVWIQRNDTDRLIAQELMALG
jgi:XisI protein